MCTGHPSLHEIVTGRPVWLSTYILTSLQLYIALLSLVTPHWASVMVLQTARMIVSEFMHVVNPWRHAAVGSQLLVNPGGMGLARVGLTGSDDHEQEDLFGPLWFAVPKKRVSQSVCGICYRPSSFARVRVCSALFLSSVCRSLGRYVQQ